MRRLLFVAALLVPLRAHANICYRSAFSTTENPPLGCPIVVYEQYPSGIETVTATRAGTDIELTASVQDTPVTLDADITDYSCDGVQDDHRVDHLAFSRFEITATDAQEGDQIYFDGVYVGVVGPSGTCAETLEPLYCTTTNYGNPCPAPDDVPPDDSPDDAVGCQASGPPPGVLVAVVLGALLGRRRRRRCPLVASSNAS